MMVWSAHETSTPRSMIVRGARMESIEVLADTKSWGFGHDVRQPRPSFAMTALSLR